MAPATAAPAAKRQQRHRQRNGISNSGSEKVID